MSDFTPGPWQWDAGIAPPDGPDRYADIYAGDTIIAHFNDQISEGKANAALIAAAPDLLEALKATYARLPNELAADMGWVEAIIARATHPTTQQKR